MYKNGQGVQVFESHCHIFTLILAQDSVIAYDKLGQSFNLLSQAMLQSRKILEEYSEKQILGTSTPNESQKSILIY